MEKKCNKCEEDKPITDWYRNSSREDGLDVICKSCRKDWNDIQNSDRNEYARMKYPTPHNICVYAFKEGDEVVYIGSSKESSIRIYRHFNETTSNSFCLDLSPFERQMKFKWNILWHGDDYEDALHIEKLNIQTFQPKFNKLKYDKYNG